MLNVEENVALAPLTTFGIGGAARWFVDVKSEDDVREALDFARKRKVGFYIFAGGSNVLVPDEGLNGVVMHVAAESYVFFETGVRADAGCSLLALIKAAAERDLGGWEHLAGIPGTFGGAVRGNAGAFGSEIKDFLSRVTAINTSTLESRVWISPNFSFSYRDSLYKREPQWLIMSATVELGHIKKEESLRKIEEIIAEREKRHLQNVAAAGSFFMNPVATDDVVALFEQEKHVKSRDNRVPAGWLIEKAGQKGAKVGGAVASEQHPNYIVNQGGATAKDVLALAAKIKDEVKKQFGVDLHEEAAVFHSLT